MTRTADDSASALGGLLYSEWIQNQQHSSVRELINRAVLAGMSVVTNGPKPTVGGLTAKQRELLLFIIAYTDEHGHTPSYDEMKVALGLASKSGIHRLVHALEERGAVSVRANRARAIEVLAVPVQVSP